MINIDEVGLLNKRVQLIRYADVEDEHGLTHQQYIPALPHKIWARIEPTRGSQYYEQYKDKTEDLTKITIRYRAGITDDMFVRYQQKLYAIKTIIDPYEAHIKLELMCSIKNRGEREALDA